MKNLRYPFILILSLFLVSTLPAQQITFEEVTDFELRNSGLILSGNQIEGYYFFYELAKVDRKTRSYLLKIYDANLKEVSSKVIEESKDFSLLEGSFNGVTLMLAFYDSKEEQLILRQYNRDTELINETTAKVNSSSSLMMFQSSSDEVRAGALFPVPYQGFINIRPVTSQKSGASSMGFDDVGYEVQFVSMDRTNKGWTYTSPIDSKLMVMARFQAANSEMVLIMVIKMPGLMDMEMGDIEVSLKALDIETGEELFSIPFGDEDHFLQPYKVDIDSETGNLIAMGQYTKAANTQSITQNEGLFAIKIDPKGELISKSFASWSKDLNHFSPKDGRDKMGEINPVQFQTMTRLSNGKIYGVGTQFKKSEKKGKKSNKLLKQITNLTEKKGLVVFQFSPNFELEDIRLYGKTESDAEKRKSFKYSFLQMAAENDGFVIGYKDSEQSKSGDKQTMFRGIILNEGKFTQDKMVIKEEGKDINILPAKPGYIMLIEHDEEAKKVTIRLEKLNY